MLQLNKDSLGRNKSILGFKNPQQGKTETGKLPLVHFYYFQNKSQTHRVMQRSLFHLVLITYGRNPLLRLLVIKRDFQGSESGVSVSTHGLFFS